MKSFASACAVWSLLLSISLGCDAGSHVLPDNHDPTLTITPGFVNVTAGASPIEFRAQLANHDGPITWSLDGPGTLSTDTGATVSYAPPRAAREASTTTVSAHAGSLEAKATVSIGRSPPITVTGRFADLDGGPVKGLKLVILGHPAVTTDAAGAFSVDLVEAPYDIGFEDPSGTVRVFSSVARSDLFFRLAHNSGAAKNISFRGQLSGGTGFPTATTTKTTLVFRPPGALNQCTAQTDKNGKFALNCKAIPGAKVSGTLHALQYTVDDKGNAVAFTGSGSRLVEVDPGQTVTGQDFALDRVASASSPLHVNAVLPAGWSLTRRGWRLQFLDGAWFADFADQSLADGWPEGGVDMVAPNVFGSWLLYDVSARIDPAATDGFLLGRATRALLPGVASTEVVVPRPLAMVSPAQDATDVARAAVPFQWEPSAGVKQVSLAVAAGGGKTVLLHTLAQEGVALPDLTELGVTVLPATQYRWSLTRLPFTEVDDLFAEPPAQDAADAATVTGAGQTFTTGS